MLDRSAFDQLFAENFALVFRYVQRRIFDGSTAEEITADVFEVAWRRLAADHPAPLPWLYRTAMNLVQNYRRRETRRQAAQEAIEQSVADSTAGLDQLDRLAVQASLERLSVREREAVRLTYWEGLTADEVGLVLRCGSQSVWTLLSRARKKLRSELQHDRAGETDDAFRRQ